MASGKPQFRVGDTVSHKKFGKGDVLDIYPLGEDTAAVISFEKSGQKKIILKYASLELVARAKAEHEPKGEAKSRAVKEVPEEVPEEVEDAEGGEQAESEEDAET